VINPQSASVTQTIETHIDVLAPGGYGQEHCHMNSAVMYVLEGKGYDVHGGVRHDWEAGDAAIVENACVHQHFNDDDIDPYDIDDVMWAVCTRSEPVEMDIIKKAWSTPLDPRIRKPTDSFHNSRGIIYAVKPYEWYRDFPLTAVASEKLREEAFSKWANQLDGRWEVI